MAPFDFQTLLDGLALRCPVRPSPLIEDAVDIELDGTRVSLQWGEGSGLIELTVALPVVIDETDRPGALLALFRALLERQWLEMGGDEGVGFGLMPSSDAVVGMASIDGDALAGPDGLLQALQEAVLSVLGEWYGLCGQVLLRPTPTDTPATADPGQRQSPQALATTFLSV